MPYFVIHGRGLISQGWVLALATNQYILYWAGRNFELTSKTSYNFPLYQFRLWDLGVVGPVYKIVAFYAWAVNPLQLGNLIHVI